MGTLLFAALLVALIYGMERMFRDEDSTRKKDDANKPDEPAQKDEQPKQDEPASKDEPAKQDEPAPKDEPAKKDDHTHECDPDKHKAEEPLDQPADSPFIIKPYIQLGTEHSAENEALELVWHAKEEPNVTWTVKVRAANENSDPKATPLSLNVTIRDLPELAPVVSHKQFRAKVTDRARGDIFHYEVFRNDQMVFSSTAAAPKPRGSRLRFVAVGDIGEDNPGAAKVAYEISKVKPDFVVVPGDMAYKRGRMSENIKYYFPVMNADEASPDKGAPLMRSILFVSVPGNHDYGRPSLTDVPNLDDHPDLFAYFVLWSQPLNGPYVGGNRNTQPLYGAQARCDAFLKASDGRYPKMANFSYDYGDTHWLVLDANEHMDWTSQELRDWVRHDLNMASTRWKFVMFHQPGFTSHARHGIEERMRLLSDIFQECGVDVVFNGHAHWYERMRPLKFFPHASAAGNWIGGDGTVSGDFQIDHEFDGMLNTHPKGIVYIVTGAGGAKLHGTSVPAGNMQPFTHKLIADRHSFTVVDVDQNSLNIRQISENGTELDRFTITKS